MAYLVHIVTLIWQQVSSWADYLKVSIASLLSILATVWFNRRTLGNDLRKIELRQEELLIRERRLADQNIDMNARVELLYKHDHVVMAGGKPHTGRATEPFVVGTFDFRNTGDGPVDLLATLVSGRELSSAHRSGLGRLGRDVVWSDLKRYYWNDGSNPAPILRGLSTTKQMLYASDQLIRLDPEEHEAMNRVDYLENVDTLYQHGHLNLVYKVFTAVLNYPLDLLYEQSEQGHRPGRHKTVQATSSPNFHRWRAIQRVLETINSLPFRLALQQCEFEEHNKHAKDATYKMVDYYARDPLGRLATPDAWRCFLLHHWDFNGLDGFTNLAPLHAPDPFGDEWRAAEKKGTPRPTIADVRKYIKKESDFNVYEQVHDTSDKRNEAQKHCQEQLEYLVRAWETFNATVDRCGKLQYGFAELVSDKSDNEYRKRWQALTNEGYLFRKSTPRRSLLRRLWPPSSSAQFTLQQLWELERYKMGTKYILVSLKAPGHDNPERYYMEAAKGDTAHDHPHE